MQGGAIQLMIGALEHLDVHEMVRPMALLSRLVTSAVPAFAQQYLQVRSSWVHRACRVTAVRL